MRQSAPASQGGSTRPRKDIEPNDLIVELAEIAVEKPRRAALNPLHTQADRKPTGREVDREVQVAPDSSPQDRPTRQARPHRFGACAAPPDSASPTTSCHQPSDPPRGPDAVQRAGTLARTLARCGRDRHRAQGSPSGPQPVNSPERILRFRVSRANRTRMSRGTAARDQSNPTLQPTSRGRSGLERIFADGCLSPFRHSREAVVSGVGSAARRSARGSGLSRTVKGHAAASGGARQQPRAQRRC